MNKRRRYLAKRRRAVKKLYLAVQANLTDFFVNGSRANRGIVPAGIMSLHGKA